MSAHVLITLDTTAPDLEVAASQDAGEPTLVTLDLAVNETSEIRVWGAIDVTDPLNAGYAEHEADAPWFDFGTPLQVRVHPNGGSIFVRARDEVLNQSAAHRTVINFGVEPPVTAPSVPQGGRRALPESKTIVTRSEARVRSEWTTTGPNRPSRSSARLRSSTAAMQSSRSQTRMRVASHGLVQRDRLGRGLARIGSGQTITKRNEGPETEVALSVLDIL